MSTSPSISVSGHVQQIFDDLRRHHLRHPGHVSGRVVKLFSLDTVTEQQIATARTEWLGLGLHTARKPENRL
jgi:hypothetical protein